MKQITIGQLKHDVTLAKLKLWMPFEITSDGVVVARVVANHEVTLAKDILQLNTMLYRKLHP